MRRYKVDRLASLWKAQISLTNAASDGTRDVERCGESNQGTQLDLMEQHMDAYHRLY